MTVLEDVKKVVGVEPGVSDFDDDLIIHINSGLMVLSQNGVVKFGTLIDKDTEWSAVYSEDKYAGIKTYLGLFVRRVFDPPQTSFTTTAIKESADEMLWRLREQARYDDNET